MAKTKTPPTDTSLTALQHDERLVIERLRRHLAYLGLTHTGATLAERLAWASRERPAHSALLEHVLAAEVDHKSQARLTRRIRSSGLVEQKTLEAFDWDFQPTLEKSLVLELAQLGFVQRHDDSRHHGQDRHWQEPRLKPWPARLRPGHLPAYAR